MWRVFYELESLGCDLLGWSNFDLFSWSCKKKLSFHCDSLLIKLVLRSVLFHRLGIAWPWWRHYIEGLRGFKPAKSYVIRQNNGSFKLCVSRRWKRQPKSVSIHNLYRGFTLSCLVVKNNGPYFRPSFLFLCLFNFDFLEQVKTGGNFFKTTDFFLQVSIKHNGQKFIWKNR